MASLCSSSAGGTRGCDWAIALQKTSEIGGGQKCKRKPNTLAKMFCEVVIWQNTEVVLGLGSSRQSSSFPQLQPCDPSCAPGPAGWSGAAPAGDVENAPLRRALVWGCVGGWLETSLLEGDVTPGSDESLTMRFLYLHPPRPWFKSKERWSCSVLWQKGCAFASGMAADVNLEW